MKKIALNRTLAVCMALLMVMAFIPVSAFAAAEIKVEENFFMLSSQEQFEQCELDNVVVSTLGDGSVKLADGATEGTLISQIYDVPSFEYLVASWNSETPADTEVEVYGRAYVDMHKEWSGWLSWGTWGKNIKRASTDDNDKLAKVDTDIFTIKGSNGEDASKFQFKVVLRTAAAGVSPELRMVSATMKNTLEGKAIAKHIPNSTENLPEKVMLDTPVYSQMIRDGAIGSVICSPTTITMMLNDKGEDLFPEEVALADYDWNYQGFGNWAFSVAAGGSYGYETYAHYTDFDAVRAELAAGYPVALSVKYSNSQGGSYPYLQNGAANSTGGHLIAIVGYETIDGVNYFYSNDSATSPDKACVQLRYREDQLDVAWSGRLAYFMHDKEEGAGYAATERFDCTLKPVEGKENEYELILNGTRVALDGTFVQSKLKKLDCGTLLYVREDSSMKIDNVINTTANQKVMYNIGTTANGNIRASVDSIFADLAAGATDKVTIYAISNTGNTYAAPLTYTKPAAEPTVGDETAPPPTDDDSVSVSGSTAEPSDGEGMSIWVIVSIAIVAAAAVAAGVIVFVKKKK